jgi:hypothetical protein
VFGRDVGDRRAADYEVVFWRLPNFSVGKVRRRDGRLHSSLAAQPRARRVGVGVLTALRLDKARRRAGPLRIRNNAGKVAIHVREAAQELIAVPRAMISSRTSACS